MKRRRLFVRVGDTTQHRLAQATADELEAVRRSFRREATREGHRRRAGEVGRNGETLDAAEWRIKALGDRRQRLAELTYRAVAHPVNDRERCHVRRTHQSIDLSKHRVELLGPTGSERVVASFGSTPAMASNIIAASATQRVIRPM